MDAKQVLAMIKEKDVKFVDFRFTDPRGKWQHTARMASATDESTFEDGVMFDGSSIRGWKAINVPRIADRGRRALLATIVIRPWALVKTSTRRLVSL